MNNTLAAMMMLFSLLPLSEAAESVRDQAVPRLKLIATLNLPGHFLTNQSIFQDGKNAFLANFGGTLYVVSLAKGFPTVSIPVVTPPLWTDYVVGDGSRIYVAVADGMVHVFDQNPPFGALGTIPFSPIALSSISVDPGPAGEIAVGIGSTNSVANASYRYFSGAGQSDAVIVATKAGFVKETIGAYEPGLTGVFSRSLDEQVATLPNLGGNILVHLFVGGGLLIQMVPGCCGTGALLYDAATFQQLSTIRVNFVDSVATTRHNGKPLLILGTEGGLEMVYDITDRTNPIWLSQIDLRLATHQIPVDAVECRSTVIGPNGLVLVGSSGNYPNTPTLFVLKLM